MAWITLIAAGLLEVIGGDAGIPGIEAPISPVMHIRDHWMRGRFEAA